MSLDTMKLALEAGLADSTGTVHAAHQLKRFAALVAAAERNKVAAWMIELGYATGHGDTVEDLLNELEWQVRERERDACAKVAEKMVRFYTHSVTAVPEAIMARGKL